MAAEKRKVVCWTKKTQFSSFCSLFSLFLNDFFDFCEFEFFSFVKKGDKVCVRILFRISCKEEREARIKNASFFPSFLHTKRTLA